MSSNNKKTFRLIKYSQKLCADIVEMQGTADKNYRYTICQDVRKMSEDVIHLIRRANRMAAGNEKRMEIQGIVDEKLEDIKDLLPIVGKLLNCGVKKEAQIELSIENLQVGLHNWMEHDQKIAVSSLQQYVRKTGWKLYESKHIYDIVKDYYSNNNDERIGIAYDESKARFRNAYRDYEKAVNLYDKAIKRLRDTQERFHKDDSVLYEVIKEIEADRNISILHNFYDKSFKPDHITVKEKKAVLSKADSKILEDYGDILSEGTKKKLEEGF